MEKNYISCPKGIPQWGTQLRASLEVLDTIIYSAVMLDGIQKREGGTFNLGQYDAERRQSLGQLYA